MACDDTVSAETALATALSGPAEVSGDAGSVRSHSLPDLIAAHKYLAGVCAANSPSRGLRFNRFVPDGAVRRRPWASGGAGNGWGFDRWRDA